MFECLGRPKITFRYVDVDARYMTCAIETRRFSSFVASLLVLGKEYYIVTDRDSTEIVHGLENFD